MITTNSLVLTGHPLQRCGAWSVAVLADREHPDDLLDEDIDRTAQRIAGDVATAATAAQEHPAYDWWKVLFALYPNSRPTHHARSRDRAVLLPEISRLFAADDPDLPVLPCTFCSRPCGTVWTKKNWPMVDSDKALNTLPPGVAGWPVCRYCRVALWALPYGAWVTAGSATVLTSDDPLVERAFCERNVQRASRIQLAGFKDLPAGAGPEAVTIRALREHAVQRNTAATLWHFKNDNQEPWLRVSSTRQGMAGFLRAMFADPECRGGWYDLQRALEYRDKNGTVKLDGATAVARTLFDRDGEASDRLPLQLLRRAGDPDKVSARTLRRWRALSRLYLEVMHDMSGKQLEPVTRMLTDWIGKESTRGRFNDYRRAAGNAYELHKLLMNASARLYLDGMKPGDITAVAPQLFTGGPQGWRLRAQLFFEVIARLSESGIPIGKLDDEADELHDTHFDPTDHEEEDITA